MTYTTEPPLPLLRRKRSTTNPNPNPNPKPNTNNNNSKLKLVCSFNGAFRPRPPSGRLRYVGGESRIVSVERSVTLAKLRSRISDLYDAPSSFPLKYQITAPDSSAAAETLVTIGSDEDVRRMVEKFHKLESYGKSARLWLFVCSSSSHDDDDGDESELSRPNRVGSGRPDTRTRAYAGAAVSNKYGDESLRKMVLLKQQQQQLLAKQLVMKLGRDDNNLVDLNCGNVAQFSVTRSSNNIALYPRDENLRVVDQVLGPQDLKPPVNCAASVPVCYNGCDANVNRENIVPCDVVRRNGLSCQYGDSLGGKVSPMKVCGGLNSSVRNHRFGVSDSRHQRCYPICVRGHRSNVVAERGRHRAVRLDGRFVARKCYLGVKPHMIAKQGQAVRVYHHHHPNSWRHCGGISEHAMAERLRVLCGIQYIHQKRCKQKGDAYLQKLNADSEEYRVGYCGAFTNVGEIMSTESLSSSVRTMDIQEDLLTGSGFGKFEGQYQTSYGSVHGVSSTCEPIRCDIDKERGLEDIAKVADISVATENQLPSEETIVYSLKKSENGRNDIRDLYINGVTSSVRNLSLSKEVDGPVVSSDASNIVTSDALLRTQSKPTDPMDEGQLISEPQIKEANGAASTPSFHYSAKLEKDSEQVEEVQQDAASNSRSGEVNHGESLNCSKVIGGSSSDLAAFYTHLATRELQTIRNSDLEFIKELGSGTYGTVYHGKWKGSNVAVKKIKPSCFTDGTLEDRLLADFWKEAHILGQLHHPNIVSFYGVVTDGPVTNLATVTEFMVNGSLKQVLRRKDRTIDRRKRLIIAMDAAFGMEYLHEKSIVHFDLKSHNFLVNMRDPQRPVCKIGDLGLSKIKQRTLVSGGMRGTVPWMAPELLNCHRKNNMVTDKVDVYSFGIVMWELLTGEEPYANLRSEEIIAGIIKGNLHPDIPSWCDPTWRSLMERCWSSDPESRPPFSEIAKELRTMSTAMNIK